MIKGTIRQYSGFSQTELEALKISQQARGECLPLYVPYHKCILKSSLWQLSANYACQNEHHKLKKCRKIEQDRFTFNHLKHMKKNNASKFNEMNVSPTLSQQFNPSILNYTRGH